MELAAVIGVLTYAGWWLDGRYGTSPWLALTGVALGLIGGTYNVLKASQRYFDDK